MFRKYITAFVLVLVFPLVASADVIYLKNGKKIRGQVIEKTDKQLRVNISGVKITYYPEEIDHIETETPTPTPPATTSAPKSIPGVSAAPEQSSPRPSSVPPVKQPDAPAPAPSVIGVPSPDAKLPNPAPNSSAVVSKEKKDLILTLIEESGTKETMTQMFSQIVEQAPEKEGAALKKVLAIDEILERLVPVYDKQFTQPELKELIAFYQSPIGRKLIKAMPSIMEDSMNASMSYFQEKMPPQSTP